MDKLRISQMCWPTNVWTTPAHDGGVFWHSHANYVIKNLANLLPPTEHVTTMSKSNVTIAPIQTILDGRSDIHLDQFGMSIERYRYIDFSYPIELDRVLIISSNRMKTSGKVFEGVFDIPSYIAILVSFSVLAVALWLISRLRRRTSFVENYLYTWGMVLRQGMPDRFKMDKLNSVGILLTIVMLIGGVLISSMYCSIMISILTASDSVDLIDSLEDLATKFTDVGIYVRDQSFMHDALKRSSFYDQLQDRVIASPDTDFEYMAEVYKNVDLGTHVTIDVVSNFDSHYDNLPRHFTCYVPRTAFRFSKDALVFIPIGWMYKKGFEYAELLDKSIMWLDAYGFYPIAINFKRETTGLFSPDPVDRDCPAEFPEEPTDPDDAQGCQGLSIKDEPLGLNHLERPIWFYSIGIALSILAFVIELIMGVLNRI